MASAQSLQKLRCSTKPYLQPPTFQPWSSHPPLEVAPIDLPIPWKRRNCLNPPTLLSARYLKTSLAEHPRRKKELRLLKVTPPRHDNLDDRELQLLAMQSIRLSYHVTARSYSFSGTDIVRCHCYPSRAGPTGMMDSTHRWAASATNTSSDSTRSLCIQSSPGRTYHKHNNISPNFDFLRLRWKLNPMSSNRIARVVTASKQHLPSALSYTFTFPHQQPVWLSFLHRQWRTPGTCDGLPYTRDFSTHLCQFHRS